MMLDDRVDDADGSSRSCGRSVFTGRDTVMRSALSKIERERRIGYAYYGTWPAALLAEEYPRWRERHRLERQTR